MLKNSSFSVIQDFLRTWWLQQRNKFETTVLVQLPEYSLYELENTLLGNLLKDIARAADGEITKPTVAHRKDIEQKTSKIVWLLYSVNLSDDQQLNTSIVPADFWRSPIGFMVLRAHLWSIQEELITLTEAAKLCGKSYSTLRGMIDRGKIQDYPDPQEPNPQRRSRVLKSKILRLSKTTANNN